MRVLFVASELNPIAKVGGLADVAGALPKEIAKLDVDIEIVIPFYSVIDREKYDPLKILPEMPVKYRGETTKISVYKTVLPGSKITVYLIKNKQYLSSGGIYLAKGAFCNSFDEVRRFEFLGHAVWELFEKGFFTHDVIHCQDWHTGYLASVAKKPTVFTIHNLANQGKVGRGPNYMKLGIEHATIINAVSPTYAKEILTPDYGEKLDTLLRKRADCLFGVLNGIDYDIFNPEKDRSIYKNYTFLRPDNKVMNKLALEKELGLDPDVEMVMLGLVSRLTSQKAIGMICDVLRQTLKKYDKMYFSALGVGDEKLEKRLKKLESLFPEKVRVKIKFDPVLAQKIYAGSDIFLMPSNFEPCGLCQMIAMRYGSIPIVRKTGGLADSVKDGTDGFVFSRRSKREFAHAVDRALIAYRNKDMWQGIVDSAMTKDFRWQKSAKEYVGLYKLAVRKYHGR